jgi:hypothetical protein
VPGLLDMLSAQPNTGSSNADPLTSLLQGPQGLWPQSGVKQSNGPPYGDSGFAALQYQSSPELIARMLQLQSLMGVKEPQPPSPYGESGFASPGYAPTSEQAARQTALAQTFPPSRNVVDLRQTPQFTRSQGCHFNKCSGVCKVRCSKIPHGPGPLNPP